ncbi:PQQ-dependent sugar dehydrogenase [Bacillus sp. FJAT-26390]|uniref:PQQ-dependent sugar dehydrogenase n=1 Tax=Bacillus sp. FJAT-26390 TaxID=1743142 RepID=UPI000807C191|nr:PQQ-dependent sugar dehydrogenase [Bacillus sp. FJAT-26390]OBZ16609.1 cellulose 1,4-beta-cellobiosidase [Bacillus sp. FJAT-26390]
MIHRKRWLALAVSICLTITMLPSFGLAAPGPVPSPWKAQNIGSPAIPGNATFDPANGKFSVSGAGTDIWGTSDQFNYVYQPWTGDGAIIALVSSQTNTNEYAKAGISIRESLNANSKHVDLLLTPKNGLAFQYRSATGGTTKDVKAASTSPYWIKLERTGNLIKGYVSNNGLNWGDLGSATVAMSNSLFVGLAVSSHNVNALSTATFENVKVNNSGDVYPPTAPTDLKVGNITNASVGISWTASIDDVGVTGYDVFKDGVLTQANVPGTAYTFTGLKADTSYSFTVKGKDAAGQVSAASSPLVVKTSSSNDTQSPTVPTGLKSTSKTSSSVSLAWTAATDNVGVYQYEVFNNGAIAAIASSTSVVINGLNANTTYSFTVKARDIAGNISAASSALSVKTNAASTEPYSVQVVGNNLEVPWALDFAPDGRIFFTERNSGRIRVIVDGQVKSTPVITLGAPFYYMPRSEGGLLGIAVDPDFNKNHYLYVYHTYRTSNNQVKNRVVRLVEKDNKATVDKVLISDLPGAVYHNGGRIKVGPDKKLYFGNGNYGHSEETLNYLGGKIFRLNLDGSIPSDNPFGPNSPIFSRGHRNPQGIAFQPGTNRLFESEHGESSHDEINYVVPGGNYGWPKFEGPNHNGTGITAPLIYAQGTTWAPSGITFVTKGPWKGDLLVANLKGKQIIRMGIVEKNGKPTISSSNLSYLYKNQYGRIRDVVEAPDGSIYFVTSNNGDKNGDGSPDKIVRLVPNF